jgi:hypothetical protein
MKKALFCSVLSAMFVLGGIVPSVEAAPRGKVRAIAAKTVKVYKKIYKRGVERRQARRAKIRGLYNR